MEYCKISKLLKDLIVPKFLTRKQIKVNDLSGWKFSANRNFKFATPILRSNLNDYSDTYIVAKGRISVRGTNNGNP